MVHPTLLRERRSGTTVRYSQRLRGFEPLCFFLRGIRVFYRKIFLLPSGFFTLKLKKLYNRFYNTDILQQ
jgi:hypothetical protein